MKLKVKERLSLYEMELIEKQLHELKSVTKKRDKKRLLFSVLRILTGRNWLFRWHLLELDSLLKEAGFEGKKEEVERDENALLKTTSWIGARINKTPHEIACNMIIKEVDFFVREISRKILQDSMALIRSYHTPQLYADEITDDLRRLSENEKDESEIIAKNPPIKFSQLFKSVWGQSES